MNNTQEDSYLFTVYLKSYNIFIIIYMDHDATISVAVSLWLKRWVLLQTSVESTQMTFYSAPLTQLADQLRILWTFYNYLKLHMFRYGNTFYIISYSGSCIL